MSTCHVEDATGKVQLTASYEATCAACHDEKISTSVARGVPMLALPTLDVAALQAAGFDIGAWPKGATGDFDGRLPPVMKLLLAADPAAAQAMAKLGADFDFQDVNPKDRQQLEACAALATAIKKLMRGIGGVGGRDDSRLGCKACWADRLPMRKFARLSADCRPIRCEPRLMAGLPERNRQQQRSKATPAASANQAPSAPKRRATADRLCAGRHLVSR